MKRMLMILPVVAAIAVASMAPAQADDGPPVQTAQGAHADDRLACPADAPLLGEELTTGIQETTGSRYFRFSVEPGETTQLDIYANRVPLNPADVGQVGVAVQVTHVDANDGCVYDWDKFAGPAHSGYPTTTPVFDEPGEYFFGVYAANKPAVTYAVTPA